MVPLILTLTEKKLVGHKVTMSFASNQTFALWNGFIKKRKEIKNAIGNELYSMQMYAPLFFDNFNPNAEFEKWATVEVTNFNNVPDGMETFVLQGGLYAVFLYIGDSSNAEETFRYLFGTWLPNSEYVLDTRPHFEVLGEDFKHNDPNSQEEIWIPIKFKNDTF